MPDYFAAQAGSLNLFQQQMLPNRGVRPGQIDALHAVLAHFVCRTTQRPFVWRPVMAKHL
ncbi:hypothetical protein ALO51_200029 [Pseudomonas amygdali]|nr:hypothetical protein ALO51_200029 [Pseudomonas amygdali]